MSLWEIITAHLRQPEYLHVLLEPLLASGLVLSALALAIALVLRSTQAQIVALILLCITSGAAWPIKQFGEQGFDRVESMSDHDGYVWLDAHAQRATRWVPVFYALSIVALVALVLPRFVSKLATPLSILTLLCAIIACGFSSWIAYAGGGIRHREFRYGTPPEKTGEYEKMRD